MKKNIFNHFSGKKIFITLLLLFAILFFVQIRESRLYEAVINGDHDYIETAVLDSTVYVYIFMLFIMIIQNTFTSIPLILVITVNVTVFGFLEGFIWSWLTSVFAAMMIFIFIRYVFSDRFSSKISSEQLKKIEDKGVSYILIARVMPFIPTSFINIIGGLSTITLRKFIIGTAIGNFIYFFILALIPAGLMSSGINVYVIAVIVMILLVLYYILTKIKGKNNKKLIRNKC